MPPNSLGSAGLAQPHVSRSLDVIMVAPPTRNGTTHNTLSYDSINLIKWVRSIPAHIADKVLALTIQR
jgi:hypothetical protein